MTQRKRPPTEAAYVYPKKKYRSVPPKTISQEYQATKIQVSRRMPTFP